MDNIKKYLKQTKDIILDTEIGIPEHLQAAAFKEVFRLIVHGNPSVVKIVEEKKDVQVRGPEAVLSMDEFFKNLAEREDLNESDFKQIFDYTGSRVSLIMHPIPGSTKADIEKNAGLLLLFAYKMGLTFDWIEASFLRRDLQNVGLGGTNFSTNMRKFKPYILTEMRHGDSGYKITVPGERRAMEIFKDFIKTK